MSRDTTGKFQPFSGGKGAGGGGGELLTHIHSTYQLLYTHQIASDNMNFLFSSNTFPPRTYEISNISQPAKICPKRTDILKYRSIGCPWLVGLMALTDSEKRPKYQIFSVLQSKLVNTDTERAIESVRFNAASVLRLIMLLK